MIKEYELRVRNNLYDREGRLCKVEVIKQDGFSAPAINGPITALPHKPIQLTKEILKNNLGFEAHDMGDFWQFEKEDFVLIQVKMQYGEMPYMFVLKSSIKEAVNFHHVHHLQNTYLDLKVELLEWKIK